MQGKRIYPTDSIDNGLRGLVFSEPGMYGKDVEGMWWARVPATGYAIGRLTNHDVVEHEDGTITVSPSILVEGPRGTWHGYLERGIWREV